MARDKSRGSKIMSGIVWVLVGMLVLGLGGFGVTNFGTTSTSIASVGDEEISSDTYFNALQQSIQSISQQAGQAITIAEAQQFGLDAQVRQQLISAAAMKSEADDIGLSVGNAAVADELRQNSNFFGPTGAFDRNTYELVLRQNNLTPAEYERELRDGIARSLLVGAVSGGFVAPAAVTDTLYNYVAERRAVSVLQVTPDSLQTPIAEPDEDMLRAYYDAHIDQFQTPETRTITYAALLPEAVAPTLPIAEDDLREIYQSRSSEFNQPERRLVERLVFPDPETAQAAKDRIDAGASFEDIVAERGLEIADTDLGDVAKADLGEAGDAVFAMTEPGVTGPFTSNFGPALFRMNGVLSAHEVPFEDVRDDLAQEYQADAARQAIADRRSALDDLLASGATIEDLGKEPQVQVATFDYSANSDNPMVGFPSFREAAEAAQVGDFPELLDLNDGGIAALRLDAITPPAPIPFDQARDQVAEAWRADALQTAMIDRATEIAQQTTNGAALDSFGAVQSTAEIARDGVINNAPAQAVSVAFGQDAGAAQMVQGPNWIGVIRTDAILPAATEGDGPAALRSQLAAQLEGAFADDARNLFTQSVSNQAGVRISQSAIDAVHSQLP
ncbi:peptidylprolyl isomerase [Falsirhodobacter sp. alg1]|uniref:peptidylprolyl isomerase n=1 Tax=Falsirhodobacter sp. alg1 TaxID=1472418 RepID=UPI0007887817|nr:peptidylprolyl isomerase [Falsirhodobacter sp. alg1]